MAAMKIFVRIANPEREDDGRSSSARVKQHTIRHGKQIS
jgi:hypothetical protein